MPSLASTPTGVKAARDDARALCRQHGINPGRGDDFVLVVSELVSNAVLHGRPPSTYDLSLDRDDLLVTVDDSHPEGPPTARAPNTTADGGRGLSIIDTLSRVWGWLPTSTGKRVWARV